MSNIQSGINQFLATVSGIGYLANKEYQPTLENAKLKYTKAKEVEGEHLKNRYEPFLSQQTFADNTNLTSVPKADIVEPELSKDELAQVGASGGLLGKMKGVKELETKETEAYEAMQEREKIISEAFKQKIKSPEFQAKRKELEQQYKDILSGKKKKISGNNHMKQKGTKGVKQKSEFNAFLDTLRNQGLSEQAIKSNMESLKKQYKEKIKEKK